VTHAFAGSFQQAGRILQLRTMEETHIDMILEHAYVRERRVFNTCGGEAIVHQLANVFAALPYSLKPRLGKTAQLLRLLRQPAVD